MAAGTRTFVMKFVGDVKSVLGDIDKIDDKFAKLSGKGKLAVGAAVAGGAAVGGAALGVFAKAISLAADYEQAIDQVGAVAGASEEQTRRLYETGKRIGKETAFSATEAASAMEELAAQGLSVEQIVSGAADATVALAAAGKTDLVTAATAAAQTMGLWGVKAEDMTDIVNRMAGAANFSKFGVEDMTLAIGQGGGVAAQAGITYQDFLASIAGTAQAFTSGADAGTGFKTFVQRLVPTGKAATKAMRDLGLITEEGHNRFFTATGDFAGMANAAEILKEGLGDLTDEARTDALKDIFGSDASRTAGELSKLGAEGFNKVSEGMGKTDAADIAAQRMGNLRGEIEKLKGSLETIAIELGEKFLPHLTKAAGFLAEWLPKIPTPVLLAVGAFAAFIGIVSAVALVLFPLIAVAGALGVGIGGLILVLSGVGLAVAAAIAVGVLLYKNWDTIKEKATQLKDWIVGVFNSLPTGIQGAMELLGRIMLAPFLPVKAAIDGIIAAKNLLTGGGDSAAEKAQQKYNITPSMFGGGVGEFASGGIVPGPRGSRQLAMVHGGETILPTHKGGGFGNINITVNGSVHSDASLQSAILGALRTASQRGELGFA